MKRLFFVAAAIVGLTACMPPRVMVFDEFVPEQAKVARTSVELVGDVGAGDNKTSLSNYYIQICDVSGKTSTNCHTTLILENITDYQFTATR